MIEELGDFDRSSRLISEERATGSRPTSKLASLASIPVTLCLKSVVLSALTVIESHAALDKQKSLSDETKQSASRASKLDEQHTTHFLNVTDLIVGLTLVNKALDEQMRRNKYSGSDRETIHTSASGSQVSTGALSLLPAIITGLTGLVTREVHAVTKFVSESKHSGGQSTKAVRGDIEFTGVHLDVLLKQASKLEDAFNQAQKFGVSALTAIGLSRSIVSGSLVGTLNSLLGIASAVSEFYTLIPDSVSKSPDSTEIDEAVEEPEKKQLMDKVKEFNKDTAGSGSTDIAPKDGFSLEIVLELAIHSIILQDRSRQKLSAEKDDRGEFNSTGKSLVDLEHGTVVSTTVNGSGFLTGALGIISFLGTEAGISMEALLSTFSKVLRSMTDARTLLNTAEIIAKTKQTVGDIKDELTDNLRISAEEVKRDSHSGKKESIIHSHSISAMRSTLSRLSEALKECAREIRYEADDHLSDKSPLVEGEMHTIQRALMNSLASALITSATFVSRLSEATGGLFLSSVLSRGRVDELRKTLRDSEQIFKFTQVDTSLAAIDPDSHSATSLSLATILDSLSNTVFNVIITLIKAATLGTNVMLSVAKSLEIVLFHEHPDAEFSLETQALLRPEAGTSASMHTVSQVMTKLLLMPTISSAGAAGMSSLDRGSRQEWECLVDSTDTTVNSLQDTINGMIDSLQVLADESPENLEPEEKESKGEKVRLRQYFSQILIMLGVKEDSEQLKTLLNRFNRGGMNLSKYHQDHGGIPKAGKLLNPSTTACGQPKKDELERQALPPLLQHSDNATAVLENFIDYIFKDYMEKGSALDTFITYLKKLESALSSKTKTVHEYLISRIASKLYTAKNISTATLFGQKRDAFDREVFIAKYTNLREIEQSSIAAITSTTITSTTTATSTVSSESTVSAPLVESCKSSAIALISLSDLFKQQDARRKARKERREKAKQRQETPSVVQPTSNL